MLGEGGTSLSKLQGAVREFQSRDERVDLKSFRAVIDALEGEFSIEAREVQRSGDHRIGGNISAASRISQICRMSVPSAEDQPARRWPLAAPANVPEALPPGQD